MFDFFRKNLEVFAPVAGRVIDLDEVPDAVFAQKMAGDGVAINTTGDIIVAPADGLVSFIFKTNHAFGMTLNNGAELLVHVGIDTIELKGEGFERLIEEGTKVKSGTPILKIDRQLIEEKGYSLITPVLISNPDILKEIKCNIDIDVEAGKETIISYKVK